MYSNGFIQSPDYPSDYPNNLNCTWYLQSSSERSILLSFATFATEEKIDFLTVCKFLVFIQIRVICMHHVTQVYEGWNVGGNVLFESSGYKEPFVVQSTSTNQLRVTFISDRSDAASGFRAYFS